MRLQKILSHFINIIFFVVLIPALNVHSFEVPFKIRERAGINRINETVIYSIPFPKSENIRLTSSLEIVGHEAEFKVLSRYSGRPGETDKPIRVVLVSFQDSILANRTKQYVLSTTGSKSKQKKKLAIDHKDYVSISTGIAQIRISKTRGNLFDYVNVNGNILIDSPKADGFWINTNGALYSSANNIPTVEIEENNSLYCIVKVSGEFENNNDEKLVPADVFDLEGTNYKVDSPLRYTIRYYAYKNKSHVRVFITLKNENYGATFWAKNQKAYEPIHNFYFEHAFLKTTLEALDYVKKVEFDQYSKSFSKGSYSVYQNEISPATSKKHRWRYIINRQKNKKGKYRGGVNLETNKGGVFVANRWFWEQFPKALSVHDNSIQVELWPDSADSYRLLGGSWKTHELIYHFHSGDEDFSNEIAFLRKRPIIYCTDDYYSKTNFVWGLLPNSIDLQKDVAFPGGESLQAAIDRQERMHRGIFDSKYLQNGLSIPEHMATKTIKFHLSDDPMRYFNWYGWLEFGGMPRAANFGFHNQHYDYSYTALSGFLRFEDYNQLEMGEIWVNHLLDVLTIHDPDAKGRSGPDTLLDIDIHGGQRDEVDALLSYHQDRNIVGAAAGPRGMSHLWTKGAVLQYLLTGDKHYLETLQHTWEHVIRMRNSTFTDNIETRHQWRGIDALLEAYRIQGDPYFLKTAYRMFTRNLLSREGGSCNDVNDPSTCKGDNSSGWLLSWHEKPNWVWMGYDAWGVEFCLKLYLQLKNAELLTEAESVKLFIGRWASWLRKNIFRSSLYPFGKYFENNRKYFPYTLPSKAINPQTGENITNAWNSSYALVYADLFIFQYYQTGDDIWRKIADSLFKDYHYYSLPGLQSVKKRPRQMNGWWKDTPSGSWKIVKSIYNPSYYLRHYMYSQSN